MRFDQDSRVVQLCAKGMELEGRGQSADAKNLFHEAWQVATNDFEKFTAAHYVARHQADAAGKLQWDEVALQHALRIGDESLRESLPSLYLNIGKGYEDLGDVDNARKNYEAALSFASFLSDNGYGKMMSAGIRNGLDRVK